MERYQIGGYKSGNLPPDAHNNHLKHPGPQPQNSTTSPYYNLFPPSPNPNPNNNMFGNTNNVPSPGTKSLMDALRNNTPNNTPTFNNNQGRANIFNQSPNTNNRANPTANHPVTLASSINPFNPPSPNPNSINSSSNIFNQNTPQDANNRTTNTPPLNMFQSASSLNPNHNSTPSALTNTTHTNNSLPFGTTKPNPNQYPPSNTFSHNGTPNNNPICNPPPPTSNIPTTNQNNMCHSNPTLSTPNLRLDPTINASMFGPLPDQNIIGNMMTSNQMMASSMMLMGASMPSQTLIMPIPHKLYQQMLGRGADEMEKGSSFCASSREPVSHPLYYDYECSPRELEHRESRFGNRGWLDDERRERGKRVIIVIKGRMNQEGMNEERINEDSPLRFRGGRGTLNDQVSGLFDIQDLRKLNNIQEVCQRDRRDSSFSFGRNQPHGKNELKITVFEVISIDNKKPFEREVCISTPVPFDLETFRKRIQDEAVCSGLAKPNPIIDISGCQYQEQPYEAVVYIKGKTVNLPDSYYHLPERLDNPKVSGLVIGNSFGEVMWPTTIDLTNIDFSTAVKIQKDTLLLYEQGKVPPLNTELNRECILTLFSCDVANALRRQGTFSTEAVTSKLRQMCRRKGLEFVCYDPQNDNWSVRITPSS